MRAVGACVAFFIWASSAAAQVSFVRNDDADMRVAAALERLIGDEVRVVDGFHAAADSSARVSIDRTRALLRVVSADQPDGLTRVLDERLLADSPYAVAVAAAELLDLLHVEPRQPLPVSRQVLELSPAPAREGEAPREAWPTPVEKAATVPEPATQPREPGPIAVAPAAREPAESEGPAARAPSHGGPAGSGPDYAIGVDLDVQAQPGYALSFIRPALYAELAWGRPRVGPFWTLGARASAPFGRDLPLAAAATSGDTQLRALSMDIALQGGLGYSFGRFAVAGHLGAGVSYLRVEALDAAELPLGHDAQLSPLVAAGIGVRLSLALGLALAVRGETQWAGRGALYRVAGEPVLEVGAFRLGLLAGILWESALGAAGP